jgi:hypothetical protein
VLFGLGVAEWLTIVGLVGGLLLTFVVMARVSVRYEQARRARERSDGGNRKDDERSSRRSRKDVVR